MIAPIENTRLPTVVISFDFEIGWGDITNPRWKLREKKGVYENLRLVLPKILTVMEELEIPASWASVGAMFDAPHERDFSHLPKNAQSIIQNCLADGENSTFDGTDLFEMVLGSANNHEIICHSYSHIPFDFADMSFQAVNDDLALFNKTLDKYDLSTDTLVFPENKFAFFDAVAANGYTLVRGPAPRKFYNRFLHVASTQLMPPPLVTQITNSHGVTEHSGSFLYNARAKEYFIPLVKRQAMLGLNELKRRGGILHLWSHPFNFSESEPLADAFIVFLRTLANQRDAGEIAILTFSQSASG